MASTNHFSSENPPTLPYYLYLSGILQSAPSSFIIFFSDDIYFQFAKHRKYIESLNKHNTSTASFVQEAVAPHKSYPSVSVRVLIIMSSINNNEDDVEVVAALDLREPPEEIQKWAEKNICEDLKTRCQVLEEFRDMIFSRGEVIPHRLDDSFLLRFLRARHFILPKAHRLLVNYYNFKSENPHFYENISLESLKVAGDYSIITVPPYRERGGKRIMLYRCEHWDPEKHTIDEVFQCTMMVLELAVLEPRAQILGGIAMFDFKGLSMQQAWHMTPSTAHKVMQIMVTSFPMVIQEIHIVNQSYIFDVTYKLFKPFLNDMMRERIFFHGENMESLHKFIDPKCLPQRYGGVHPDYNYEDWVDGFRKDPEILTELKSVGYTVERNQNED